MKNNYGNVILITGASSGIGKAAAIRLAEIGFKVYGTTREKSTQFDKNSNENLIMLKLDVCDENSIISAIETVIQKEGRIDILINNAGFGIAGSIECVIKSCQS